MLTKDFIKRVEALEFVAEVEVNTNNYIMVKDKNLNHITTVFCDTESGFDTYWQGFQDLKLNEKKAVLELLVEYTTTPVEERDSRLSDVERVVLENIDSRYHWIARDKNGNLYLYDGKPSKHECRRYWVSSITYEHFEAYNHLFQLVQITDEEPTNIQDLLEVSTQ